MNVRSFVPSRIGTSSARHVTACDLEGLSACVAPAAAQNTQMLETIAQVALRLPVNLGLTVRENLKDISRIPADLKVSHKRPCGNHNIVSPAQSNVCASYVVRLKHYATHAESLWGLRTNDSLDAVNGHVNSLWVVGTKVMMLRFDAGTLRFTRSSNPSRLLLFPYGLGMAPIVFQS
jgi:hypothetical protein